ncbi:hypothetical protein DYB37_007371 [Aphanomyces astaci]|uniref:Uncharacterized protein n=1 Tax=Aphanomyces astaci TaxID=112090 RepID=A0A3R7B2Y2_APHAT|nr:hypothetical protein DYB35_007477 [Aphanomyces astaci]RHZ35124.1 hypothetical protein DYB37_007371 [Aphanomyces astaci]
MEVISMTDASACIRSALILSCAFFLIFTASSGIDCMYFLTVCAYSLALRSRMVLLGPVMIFHGLQQGFVTGEFTAHVIRESLGSASIGIVMAVYGVVNVMSAFAFGKVADRCVRLVCLLHA